MGFLMSVQLLGDPTCTSWWDLTSASFGAGGTTINHNGEMAKYNSIYMPINQSCTFSFTANARIYVYILDGDGNNLINGYYDAGTHNITLVTPYCSDPSQGTISVQYSPAGSVLVSLFSMVVNIPDGCIQLSNSNGNYIFVSVPEFGYKTKITMPFTIGESDMNDVVIYDEGAAYDKRTCDCNFSLNSDDQSALNAFLKTVGVTGGRAQQLTLSMNTGSGFFPFGPDKGDAGPFTVSVEYPKHAKQVMDPFLYFAGALRFRNVGAWPSYSLPSLSSEGVFQIGSVVGNRYPEGGFNADNSGYAVTLTSTENNTPNFVDRGTGGDTYWTKFTMQSNQAQAAAVIAYLTGTARGNQFAVYGGNNYYIFGRDKSASGSFHVKLNQESIEITHEMWNRFNYELNLIYEGDI